MLTDSLFLDNFVLEAREKKSSEQTTWQGWERQRTGPRQIHLGNCDMVNKLSQRMQIEKVKHNSRVEKISHNNKNLAKRQKSCGSRHFDIGKTIC